MELNSYPALPHASVALKVTSLEAFGAFGASVRAFHAVGVASFALVLTLVIVAWTLRNALVV